MNTGHCDYIMRLVFVTHWLIIYKIAFKDIMNAKSLDHDIYHHGLHLLKGQWLLLTDPLSQSMTFNHQIVFNIWNQVTGLWNIGHHDLLVYLLCRHIASNKLIVPKQEPFFKILGKITGPWDIGHGDLRLYLLYRSCWRSLNDTQVKVIRLTGDWRIIFINCLHKIAGQCSSPESCVANKTKMF